MSPGKEAIFLKGDWDRAESSITRDPASSALLKAAKVFSGASFPPARWDIT